MEWSLSLSRGGVVKEQSSPRNELSYLLTLKRRWKKSIYSLGGEGVHGPRPKSMRAGRAGSSGDGRKVRWPEVPGKVRPGSGLNRELARLGGPAGVAGPEVPGWGRKFRGPEVPGLAEACPCFFFLLFQASLADGVVVHVRWHSSSLSVVLRQYLCMHTGEVSSSIPSSKGSSAHV